MTDYTELKRLAEAATPQNFDSAEDKSGNGYIECPHCGGSGEVELEADYCNYDGVAIGVQFYGIGYEFGAAEAYYRAANPAAVLALLDDLDEARNSMKYACVMRLKKEIDRLRGDIEAIGLSRAKLAGELSRLRAKHNDYSTIPTTEQGEQP